MEGNFAHVLEAIRNKKRSRRQQDRLGCDHVSLCAWAALVFLRIFHLMEHQHFKIRSLKKVKLLLGSAVFVVYADYAQRERECIKVCSGVMENLLNCGKWKTDVMLLDFNHR